MNICRPALNLTGVWALVCVALAGCGGGTGDKPATSSAQVSPVTDAASAVVAAAAVAEAASDPASAASAASASEGASAPTNAATMKRMAATTTTKAATTSPTGTAATATTNTGAATGAATTAKITAAATTSTAAATPSTAISAVAPTLVAPKTVVASGPTRFSPLWRMANETTVANKTGALTGMALLTTTSTGIFNGARTAKEDWPALVNRIKTDTAVSNWIKVEQTRVDAWMAKNFERADLIGGWLNYYIDAKTGALLKWSPNDAEPPAGTTALEKRFKAAWVAQGRTYNIAQMLAAARLYRATGNAKYADWAAKQLDFYATQYSRWPVSTYEGRSTMYMQGLDEAVDLFPMIDTARLLDAFAGSTRAATWRNQLFMPMAANLKSTSAPKSNIQLWHASAIAAIAMRYKDTALLEYAINDPAGIKANMAAGLTADNLWIEGTFSYNTYVIEALSKLLVMAGIEGYADRFIAEADAALRMLLAPMEYRFDNGTLPNPGDSTSVQVPVNNLAHWYLFRTMPTYWGVSVAAGGEPGRCCSTRRWPTSQPRHRPSRRRARRISNPCAGRCFAPAPGRPSCAMGPCTAITSRMRCSILSCTRARMRSRSTLARPTTRRQRPMATSSAAPPPTCRWWTATRRPSGLPVS